MSISTKHKVISKRHLIAVTKPGDGVFGYQVQSQKGVNSDSDTLLSIVSHFDATIRPLMEKQVETTDSTETAKARRKLTRFHSISAPENRIEELKISLLKHPLIETVYVKPMSGVPTLPPPTSAAATASAAPSAQPHPPTSNFTSRQSYLNPAPVGIDVNYSWSLPGGRGAGVNIIDCEWAWNFNHEDLAQNCNGVVVAAPGASDDDHGTSVAGVVIANDNGFGTTGIAPDSIFAAAAFDDLSDKPTSIIITEAADKLRAGDILLLEIHRAGPHAPSSPNGQQGFIAIEWWPDDFNAIVYATSKGILVVEAAGNGGENLDDPDYNNPDAGFPKDWANPFAVGGPNSGAILVGAGNPPYGTHGRVQDTYGFNENYVDRARCSFSNYGSRLDCQGWGWEVTTLGGGDLQSGNHNALYTDVFAGTSSASPIIAGGLACIQGALRNKGMQLLNAATARNILKTTGSVQQPAPGRPANQNIGARPDLKQILISLGAGI
jgi:hypothetical protein